MFHRYSPSEHINVVPEFMQKVYGWMFLALSTTSIATYICYVYNEALIQFFQTRPFVPLMIFFGQLIIGMSFALGIKKLSFYSAFALFTAYATITGLSFSFIFMTYTPASIFSTFVVASLMFGIMCVYGYFTKADLGHMRFILMMGVVGLFVGGLVNIFMQSSGFEFVLSIIGVIVFTLLTAYDVQRIKTLASSVSFVSQEDSNKIALFGAFQLYLDFILLFQYLLRLMGRRRN